jgi:hypothetical protein
MAEFEIGEAAGGFIFISGSGEVEFLTGFVEVGDFTIGFSGDPVVSFAPHCSQKLLEGGFFELHLGQILLSDIILLEKGDIFIKQVLKNLA